MNYMDIYSKFDPPYESFDNSLLCPEFAKELDTVSRMLFICGYRPGIAAYLNFFLLKDFIVKHDTAYAPRFKGFKSMGDSFYQTDLFIRDVTDSGLKPTGGISNREVRDLLFQIMARHQNVTIPIWMMTYFGFSLLENVEKQCPGFTDKEKQWHLQYMAKTYRIMGMPFSSNRADMEAFARAVEGAHAGLSPHLEKHARNILLIGEMVGASSAWPAVSKLLPDATRAVFEPVYPRVRPSAVKRIGARLLGRVAMKQAVGAPRKAVPVAA